MIGSRGADSLSHGLLAVNLLALDSEQIPEVNQHAALLRLDLLDRFRGGFGDGFVGVFGGGGQGG